MKTKAKILQPPEELEGEALLEWGRICDDLSAIGQLEKTDRALLVVYCETWSVHRAATAGVVKEGPVIRYANDMVGPNPFYKIQKETAALLRGFLRDMGLTRESRTRVSGEAQDLDI